MQAGLLKDFIIIRRPVINRDEYGAESIEWINVYNGRGWVRFSSGTQKTVNGETINAMTKKVVIRYKSGFNASMRIENDGMQYRILSMDRSREQQSLTFVVELINE